MQALSVLLVAPFLSSLAMAQNPLYSTQFDSDAGWTFVSNNTMGIEWGVDSLPVPFPPTLDFVPYFSSPTSLNFNHPVDGLPFGGPWSGSATSPEIDLASAPGGSLLDFRFGYYHEVDCTWDALTLEILEVSTGTVVHSECLSRDFYAHTTWSISTLELDPQWGRIQVRFSFDTIDHWNLNEAGPYIDDLKVIPLPSNSHPICTGMAQVNGSPAPRLSSSGSLSIAADDFTLLGHGFPRNTFAFAFAGTQRDVFYAASGFRCIAAVGALRLPVAPTGQDGDPAWALHFGASPLDQITAPGQTLYLQTIYRDAQRMNFSDAVVVVPAP